MAKFASLALLAVFLGVCSASILGGVNDLVGNYYDFTTGQYSSALTGRVYNTAPFGYVNRVAPVIAAPGVAPVIAPGIAPVIAPGVAPVIAPASYVARAPLYSPFYGATAYAAPLLKK